MIVTETTTTTFNSPIDFSIYNISELARRIGVSRVHLTNCVNGKSTITKKLYHKLLDTIGLKEEMFIYGVKDLKG